MATQAAERCCRLVGVSYPSRVPPGRQFGFSWLGDLEHTVRANEAEGRHGLFFLMLCYHKTSGLWGSLLRQEAH